MNIFTQRRQALFELMGGKSMAILATAPVHYRSRNIPFPFRPDSDFYYLTGFSEPDALAVFIPQRPQGEFLLFCREQPPALTYGHTHIPPRHFDTLAERYAADDVFPINDIDDIIPNLLEQCRRLYYPLTATADFHAQINAWLQSLTKQAPEEIINLNYLLHELRLYKSSFEISALRDTADCTQQIYLRALSLFYPTTTLAELHAEIAHESLIQGCIPAYPPVIITSPTKNRLEIQSTIMLELAMEYHFYTCRLARTYPVGNTFTPAQQAIYAIITAAHTAGLAEIYPENSCDEAHHAILFTLLSGLKTLGIVQENPNELLATGAYKRFIPHPLVHWIGIDVYDVGEQKIAGKWRILEENMTLVLATHLCLPISKTIAPEYWQLSMQLVDTVVLTATGHEVLTTHVPYYSG